MYDDACHVLKFLNKRKKKIENSERGKILIKKKHFIDKLHISNHKDPWCLTHCNPNNENELNGINTVVSEQFNFWCSGFKYMMKHMNYQRFHFFIFIMFDFYNIRKTDVSNTG